MPVIPPNDLVRLQHMLDMARKATDFVAGKSCADFDTDEKLALALVRALEIIGEAANHVSPQVRNELSAIPLAAGHRHEKPHHPRLHDVDLSIVWETIRDELVPLIAAVEAALKPRPAV